MKLTIIGSGTCVPSTKRGAPANYLEIAGSRALVDCGPGTLKQLEKAKLDYKLIDMVFISHFHSDHISDLGPLVQASNWTPGFERKKNLTFIGPPGFENFYRKYIKPVCGSPRPDTYEILIEEIEDSLDFPGFRVEALSTTHSPESTAYKFIEAPAADKQGETASSLIISGDCDFDENSIEFAKNCHTLLLECSFKNNQKVKGHLTPKECGQIAQKSAAKKLILTHLYPPLSAKERLKETKKLFDNTILAEDFMEFLI
ncbi:MAG: MBL fold metallo-hydrolase [Candidatus Aminicenantes bacterium]|nr:MBL fold metallo-hydrolase [Candidatus Aminicenantes bacterium]